MRQNSRARDEEDLALLCYLQQGKTVAQAAKALSLSPRTARRRAYAIRDSDVRADPEAGLFWSRHPITKGLL